MEDQWRLCDVYWAPAFEKDRKSREWALLAADGTVEETDGDQGKNPSHDEEDEDENIHTFNEFYFLTDPDRLVCTHIPNNAQWQLLLHPFTEGTFEKYAYLRERFFEVGMTMVEESKEDCIIKTVNGEVKLVFGLKENTSQLIEFKFHLHRAKRVSDDPVPCVCRWMRSLRHEFNIRLNSQSRAVSGWTCSARILWNITAMI